MAAKSGKIAAFKMHCTNMLVPLNEMVLSCIGSKPMMKRDNLIAFLMKAKFGVNKHFSFLKDDFVKVSVSPVLFRTTAIMDQLLNMAEKICDDIIRNVSLNDQLSGYGIDNI